MYYFPNLTNYKGSEFIWWNVKWLCAIVYSVNLKITAFTVHLENDMMVVWTNCLFRRQIIYEHFLITRNVRITSGSRVEAFFTNHSQNVESARFSYARPAHEIRTPWNFQDFSFLSFNRILSFRPEFAKFDIKTWYLLFFRSENYYDISDGKFYRYPWTCLRFKHGLHYIWTQLSETRNMIPWKMKFSSARKLSSWRTRGLISLNK